MKIFDRLRCAISAGHSAETYYGQLSQNQLEDQKRRLAHQYLLPVLAWIFSAVIMIGSVDMDLELLLLYVIAVSGTVFALVADFRRRKRLIAKLLEEKRRH